MTSDGPPAFDTSVAHQARIYDYLLGGKDNYAADRAASEAVLTIYPEMAFNARANRAFLGRAVRYLAGKAGIRQFLDIGTGIPTAGNTHPAILDRAAQLLDFSKPVAVTLIAILHAIPDSDDPHAVVARLMDALPPGSHLAISHIAADLIDSETRSSLDNLADQMIQQDFTFRSGDQVARFLAGTDLVAPGLVRVEEWRPEPDDPAGTSSVWGAVGRKR
jgi:hypothetical protein